MAIIKDTNCVANDPLKSAKKITCKIGALGTVAVAAYKDKATHKCGPGACSIKIGKKAKLLITP